MTVMRHLHPKTPNGAFRPDGAMNTLHRRIPGQKVPRQCHQVRLQPVRDGGVAANLIGSHEGADLEVGKLDDAKPSKALGKRVSRMRCCVTSRVKPPIEKALGAGHKRCSTESVLPALVGAMTRRELPSTTPLSLIAASCRGLRPPAWRALQAATGGRDPSARVDFDWCPERRNWKARD
jgi:hypothetical protein